MEDEIDLRDILLVLWKNRLLIVGIFLIAVVAAGAISFAMPSVYRVSCIVALGNFGDPIYTTQDAAFTIMTSDGFILDALNSLNLSVSRYPSELSRIKDNLKISPVSDADRLLVISLDTRVPKDDMRIVEEIVGLFVNRSEESYREQKRILSDQLASTLQRQASVEKETNQTKEALANLEKARASSQPEDELRYSRTLDLLSDEESRLNALIDRHLDLQKQLDLLKSAEFVQWPRESTIPI